MKKTAVLEYSKDQTDQLVNELSVGTKIAEIAKLWSGTKSNYNG